MALDHVHRGGPPNCEGIKDNETRAVVRSETSDTCRSDRDAPGAERVSRDESRREKVDNDLVPRGRA